MPLLIDPCGRGLRGEDKWGSGHFLASRGGRPHWGVDWIAEDGQEVFMPCHGVISRICRPYAEHPQYGGYEIRSDSGLMVRLFYLTASSDMAGRQLCAGSVVGRAQTLQPLYAGITDHIHMEVRPPRGWPFPISWCRGKDYELCETGTLPGWRVDPALLV